MTLQNTISDKVHNLPDSLAEEVSDFIDFLLLKRNSRKLELWRQFTESAEIAESDFSDYLSNLEDYEDSLSRGEIQW